MHINRKILRSVGNNGAKSYLIFGYCLPTSLVNCYVKTYVYWRHPRSSVDRYPRWTFDGPSIDTRSTLHQHLSWHSIWKPTHTDRLVNESSYNPASHKVTTIKTLTRRARIVCDTLDSLRDETRCLERVFHRNNYNADFIRQNICRLTEADATNRNPTPVTTPYIWGTSETISRILQPHNIREAHKPTTTLGHLLTSEEQMLRLPCFLHWWDWQKP